MISIIWTIKIVLTKITRYIKNDWNTESNNEAIALTKNRPLYYSEVWSLRTKEIFRITACKFKYMR